MMEVNREARLANQARVRDLALTRSPDVRVFSAHDAVEFEQLAGTPAGAASSVRQPPAWSSPAWRIAAFGRTDNLLR
jgi:hypothetical protein